MAFDLQEGFTALRQFVLKHVTKHAKTIVVGGFPQGESAGKTTQVDILYEHSIVPLGYRGAECMTEVFTLVGNLLVDPGDPEFLFVVVVGTGLHPGQLLLGQGQPRFRLTVVTGIFSHTAIAVHIKGGRGVIQPQSLLNGSRLNILRKLVQDRNEVFPGGRPLNSGRFQAPAILRAAVLRDAYIAHLGQMNKVLSQVNCWTASSVLALGVLSVSGVAVFTFLFALEFGKSRILSKEGCIRFLQCHLRVA